MSLEQQEAISAPHLYVEWVVCENQWLVKWSTLVLQYFSSLPPSHCHICSEQLSGAQITGGDLKQQQKNTPRGDRILVTQIAHSLQVEETFVTALNFLGS